MQLTEFRVTNFRNIVDSGPIAVDELVTCLVGMNESGKTSLLQALHRLNPVDGMTFDLQRDYPRWKLVADRRAGNLESTVAIEAVFGLDDDDQAVIAGALGEGTLRSDTVTVTRKYDGEALWTLDKDKRAAITNVLVKADVRAETAHHFDAVGDLDGIEPVCSRLAAGADAELGEEIERIREVLAELPGTTTGRAQISLLRPRLPRFFYFADYALLQGRIDIEELAATSEETGSSPQQTARALLALAGTTPEALTADDYEERRAELEAVGHDLTRQVFAYWQQNPDLRVQFDIDRRLATPTGSHGAETVETYVDIRVEDPRHAFTTNFDQRSSGFRWFFSFLAAFTEFETRHDNIVVLLDEPGLRLHGRAQGDFLRFINDRLSHAVQVIYTTHSPFMVETDRLHRVRIVEDGGPEVGAVAARDVLTAQAGSVAPVRAALGYDAVRHLFESATNLLVEGPSDLVYLDVIGRRLADLGHSALDPRWRVLPAGGGAAGIAAFLNLMGHEADVTVVVDSGTARIDRLEEALATGGLSRERLIHVADLTRLPTGDIEDLFSVEDYLRLFNEAHRMSYTPLVLGPGDRIVERLTAAHGRFDHFKPAQVLLRNPRFVDELSETTLDGFARLIDRINATLPAPARLPWESTGRRASTNR
ncbi:MAG: AAA family ATPase [Aeromicrobium sp.]|uniref:AAA family ATPase n=1 Tax=Aeromicrobium sp. TaxID=1871063 RepID=UPI0039E22E5A